VNMHDDGPEGGRADASVYALDALREELPGFRIWREDNFGRVRYVARSQCTGLNPHTVVTADLGELRPALSGDLEQPPADGGQAFDAGKPSIARVYDRWLGGKNNFAADRTVADALTAEFPEIAEVAKANRQFVARAVRYVAAQGITQYIDVGAGLPASPAVHEIVQKAQPGARVAYVDHDPLVLSHARAILASGPGVVVVAGDMREPDPILGSPDLRALVDLRQPICILLASVLHFVTPDEADAIVAAFTTAMAPGSYLILSAGTSTGTSPALIARTVAAYQGTTVVSGRAEAEIAAYFDGLGLVAPGLVDVWAWRPDSEWYWPLPPSARILGAVALKPAVGPGEPATGGLVRRAVPQQRDAGRPA
jgi:O-methyltransferase involved in polyketide biosynthesis